MQPTTTTRGSVAAMITGMAAVVLPSIPPQWQWLGQIFAGALATYATYHP